MHCKTFIGHNITIYIGVLITGLQDNRSVVFDVVKHLSRVPCQRVHKSFDINIGLTKLTVSSPSLLITRVGRSTSDTGIPPGSPHLEGICHLYLMSPRMWSKDEVNK